MPTDFHFDPLGLEAMRSALHDAVDRVIDGFRPEGAAQMPHGPGEDVVVIPGDLTGEWPYTWPDGSEETFPRTRFYEAHGSKGAQRVRLAWGRRPAWGKADRRRAIVFNQLGPANSRTYYPWTEFVETDDGRFAAPIPNPERPRAMIADPSRLPGRFQGATVERSDALFRSVAEGPSLRLVVAETQEEAMVRHGYWVALLRGRI